MRLEQLPIWPRGGGRRVNPSPRRPDGERGATAGSPVLRRLWQSTRGQWKRFALLAVGVYSLYSLLLSPHGWLRLAALKSQVQRREAACQMLRASRDSLDLVLAELDRGGGYILERRAREEFGFLRSNERAYILPRDAEDDRCIGEAAAYGAETFSQRALRLSRR